MHVFKFSSRPGTTAYYLKDNIDSEIKNERSSILIDISQKSFAKFREAYDGREMEVLWEINSNTAVNEKSYSGLTNNYIRVKSNTLKAENSLEKVKLHFNTNNPYGPMDIKK